MPRSGLSPIRAAWRLFRQGLEAEAVASLATPRPEPGDLAERAMLAALLLAAGDADAALAWLHAEWEIATPEAAGLAGALLLARGRFQRAVPALRRAHAHAAEAHALNLGRALSLVGRADEALPVLRAQLMRVGDAQEQVLLRCALAEALLALGDVPAALLVLQAGGDAPAILRARVVLLVYGARHEEAHDLIRQSLVARPGDTGLLQLAADLALLRGRHAEARHLLREALARDEANIALWAGLVAAEVDAVAREQAAQRSLQLALVRPELRHEARAVHGQLLAGQGRLDLAEAAYREALASGTELPRALAGLGVLLLTQGRMDEAMDCLERLRAGPPLQGWDPLIRACVLPSDPSWLASLLQAVDRLGWSGAQRTGLLLSMAAAYDRAGAPAQALRLAREANATVRRAHRERDPSEHARAQHIMARLGPQFFAERADFGHSSTKPVFVLGMQGAGSELAAQLLGCHSRIGHAGALAQIPALVAQLEAWEAKLGSPLRYPDCLAELSAVQSWRCAEQLLAGLERAGGGRILHVVDARPGNVEHIGLIRLLFPNAAIIHCRREPRELAIAHFLDGDHAAKLGAQGWTSDFDRIAERLADEAWMMAHWRALFPGQILEIEHAMLLADPEGAARCMLSHLALPWEEGVLGAASVAPAPPGPHWPHWRDCAADLMVPLEQALARTPVLPTLPALPPPGLYRDGMALLAQGHAAGAECCFRQLLAALPEHAAAWQFLGVALQQQGRSHAACQAMRASLAREPGHPSWWENLVHAALAAGERALAEEASRRAQALRLPGD